MRSAFGVEHGEIAKFGFDPTNMQQAHEAAKKKGKKTFKFNPASMKAGLAASKAKKTDAK